MTAYPADLTDHLDRLFDLGLYDGDLRVQTPSPDPAAITGARKAAQMYLLTLLTRRGSAADPTRGTGLLAGLTSGAVRDTDDLRAEFQFANDEALAQMPVRARADETVVGGSLTSAHMRPGAAELVIRLQLQSGGTHTLLVPLPSPLP